MEAIRSCFCGACDDCRKCCSQGEAPQRGDTQQQHHHPSLETPQRHTASTGSSESTQQEKPLKDMDEPVVTKAPSGTGSGSSRSTSTSGDSKQRWKSKPKEKPEAKVRLCSELVRHESTAGSASSEETEPSELLARQFDTSGEGSGTSMGGTAEDTSTSPEDDSGKGPTKA
ncbi:hypothetical protein V5799_020436 [Amblyomma americanum]|uniref:Uncharacterized protein n=1 Tax=Amblyomma americanum TaxID=6943 RepID=A0AAQ4EU25_AMBAM